MVKGHLASFVIGAIGGGFAVAYVSRTLPQYYFGNDEWYERGWFQSFRDMRADEDKLR
ncbi:hypothetical protein ACFLX5_00915 [Chloroflexota bacterium]